MSSEKQRCDAYAWKVTYVRDFRTFLENQPIFQCKLPDPDLVKSNLAYGFHYLEYLEETFRNLDNLPTTIKTMLAKTHLITGAGIVEAVLYCLIRKNGLHRTKDWQLLHSVTSNEQRLPDNTVIRIETLIQTKLSTPEDDEMTFDSMAKKVESKKLLGSSSDLYQQIKELRRLRNRVHIHESNFGSYKRQTDWHAFNPGEVEMTQKVIYQICSAVFSPSNDVQRLFGFLTKTAWGKPPRAAGDDF